MIRVLLVDDEEPARHRMRQLLAEFPDVEIVGEAADGDDALEQIAVRRPDLVFLDIQMPGLNGLQVAAALRHPRPRVVFCTAYDRYAVEAFEHHAVDYLLKPLRRDRLAATLERLLAGHGDVDRLQREVDAASRTQARLLPQNLPACSGLDLCGSCRPALGVGGDWYDGVDLGHDRLGLTVGDVSGKGLYAGLLMAATHARLLTLAPRYGADVAAMMHELNRVIDASTDGNRYATVFYGVLDRHQRRLTYVNAGHEAPLLFRAGRGGPTDTPHRVDRLRTGGMALGMVADAAYEQGSTSLGEGDVLVAFSDGISEAFDPAPGSLPDDSIAAIVERHADESAVRLHDRLQRAVKERRGDSPQHDDETLFVAKVVGGQGVIRALLVDDEGPARKRMRRLLVEHGDIEIVGEAGDGEQALEKIAETRPDLVFLDIQMPGCSGMEVATSLPSPGPRIVFCTAYDEYAVDAFEVHAVDYLLKPVNRARLAKALERVRTVEPSESRERVDAASRSAGVAPARLLARRGSKLHVVPVEATLFFQAEGGATKLQTAERHYWMQPTLNDLEQRLDDRAFFRISRAAIVRLDAVREIVPHGGGGGGDVILRNGQSLEVSRRRFRALMDRMSL